MVGCSCRPTSLGSTGLYHLLTVTQSNNLSALLMTCSLHTLCSSDELWLCVPKTHQSSSVVTTNPTDQKPDHTRLWRRVWSTSVVGRTMKLHLYPETKGRELFKKGYKSQLRCVKKRYEHDKIIKTKGFVWELGNNMSTQTPNNKVDKGAKPSNGRANTPHLIDQTPLTARLHLDFKPDQHGGLFRNWSLFISTRWKILRTRTVTDTPPKHDATTTVRYCEGCN